MKAGFVTFQYGDNFGGVLQTLALQQAVELLGVDVEVIDYVPAQHQHPKPWQGWGLAKGLNWSRIVERLIRERYGRQSAARFERFREARLKRSTRIHSLDQFRSLSREYDLLISGSDQIWHLNRSPIYFLDAGPDYTGRRISYASCCGHLEQPDSERVAKAELLFAYDAVSVRNDFSAEIIGGLLEREPPVVVDPTLLVELDASMSKPEGVPERYILMYCLGGEINGTHQAMLAEIKKRVGDLPVVGIVASSHKPRRLQGVDQILYTIDPGEWMWLIAHAAFFYTDSFHGILFGLKHQRPVLAYYREAQRSPRMTDLARRYKLQERIVDSVAAACETPAWEQSPSAVSLTAVEEHAKASWAYLRNALSGASVVES